MTDKLLSVEGLTVSFPMRKPTPFSKTPRLQAVRGVNFHIDTQESLGLVGESGSGKSTTGRAILRLIEPDSGTVKLEGVTLGDLNTKELRTIREDMQMVFQDPYSSLDPSSTVGNSVEEPLIIHTDLSKADRHEKTVELLNRVGLNRSYIDRYPHEFSGGQRQRIAIARAIAVNPKLVVCDEPVSALDVSTQNQVVNLLAELQNEFEMSYLFIAHDLAVVRHVTKRTAVMYLGEIVEQGLTIDMFEAPTHPYTEALLSAAPVPNPVRQRERERIVLEGDPPSPANPPSGCSFHPRCPYVMDICKHETPPVVTTVHGGFSACHLHTSGPKLNGETVVTLRPNKVA